MTEKEEKELLKLTRRNDRLLTQIAKALHLIPVTEEEEREIQLTRRANESQAEAINTQFNQMENKNDHYDDNMLGNLFSGINDTYGDVIAEDYLNDYEEA